MKHKVLTGIIVRLKSAIILLLSMILLGCDSVEESTRHEAEFLNFGTHISVVLYDVDNKTAQAAFDRIQASLNIMHREWHAWDRSKITELNDACKTGQSVHIEDPTLLTLIQKSQQYYQQSLGYFNPAAGRIIALWGFHAQPEGPQKPPSDKAIADFLSHHVSMNNIVLSKNNFQCNNPFVQLDLGGIAKGYALDYLMDNLLVYGIRNALINAGGDVLVSGSPEKRFWQVGILDPATEQPFAAIALSGRESIVTSGTYARAFEYEGKRYHHIINPYSGYPGKGLVSVTVIHSDPAFADAAATAIIAAGSADWKAIATQMGIDAVLVIDQEGHLFISPAMKKRML